MAKRLFDIAVTMVAGIVALPVFLLVALAVRIDVGSPVLFRQTRPGLGGKAFQLVKFRSMTDARGEGGCLLPNEQRITRFGRFLRASSLDELPELWNVLKGDMSLVGPRPLLMEYLPLYTAEQARRHELRPGITGWAQVNGRNTASWDDRFAMDLWYVDNHGFWLDLKILALTVMKVLRRDGISVPGRDTIERFKGSEKQ